jgi:hypothetical protein
MGDGRYMFADPVACHQVAEAVRLPILVVVMNNGITMGDRVPDVAVSDGTQVELDKRKACVYPTPREKWNRGHGSG